MVQVSAGMLQALVGTGHEMQDYFYLPCSSAYEFCASHGVPHRNRGKLVVASSQEEAEELTKLVETGRTNGVENLRIADGAAIRS
jgi:hypothetical protein